MTKDYVIYLLGKLFPAALSFLVMVFVIKTLPASEYGAYSLFLATSGFLSNLFFSWIRLSVTRKFEHVKFFFSANELVFLLAGPLMLLLLVMVLVSGLWWFEVFGWRLTYEVIAISLMFAAAVGLFDVVNEFNRVSDRALRYNVSMIIKSSAISLLVLVLYLLNEKNWVFFALSGILGGLAGLIVTAWLQKDERYLRFEARKIKKKLRVVFLCYGMPFSLSILVSFFIFNSDRYILTAYSGTGVLGEYGAVSNLVMLCVNTVLSTLCLVWNPKLFRLNKKEGLERALRAHYDRAPIFIGIALMLVLLSGLVGSVFYQLIGVENSYTDCWSIMAISLGYACLYLKVYYLDTLLQLFNETRRMLISALIVAVCSVAFNFLFIPRFGAMAIPASYVVAAIFGAALVLTQVSICQKK